MPPTSSRWVSNTAWLEILQIIALAKDLDAFAQPGGAGLLVIDMVWWNRW